MRKFDNFIDPARFQTTTLARLPTGADVRAILAAALDAVDPYRAVVQSLKARLDSRQIPESNVIVAGAGKAAYPMALAAQDCLGSRIHTGLVITKTGQIPENNRLMGIRILEAAHPVPDNNSLNATHQLVALLGSVTPDDLVLCLISGGGSALMTDPVDGVSLADLQALTGLLLRSGANIEQINTLRKHLDRVKGGGLAKMANPARTLALILSDVTGDRLDAIASGPTVPDPTTFQQAWDILTAFDLLVETPPGIRSHLQRGITAEVPETLKPGDAIFERVENQIIASNALAAQAAVDKATQLGFNTRLLTTTQTGEASEVGIELASELANSSLPRPFCMVAGGETTVTLRGNGLGGRNQQLALASVPVLAGVKDVLLVALATDGGDGPTDAAGAVVNGETLTRAAQLGLDPTDYLQRYDAYHFFQPLGDLLMTGPTQTNVNDLTLLFGFA